MRCQQQSSRARQTLRRPARQNTTQPVMDTATPAQHQLAVRPSNRPHPTRCANQPTYVNVSHDTNVAVILDGVLTADGHGRRRRRRDLWQHRRGHAGRAQRKRRGRGAEAAPCRRPHVRASRATRRARCRRDGRHKTGRHGGDLRVEGRYRGACGEGKGGVWWEWDEKPAAQRVGNRQAERRTWAAQTASWCRTGPKGWPRGGELS